MSAVRHGCPSSRLAQRIGFACVLLCGTALRAQNVGMVTGIIVAAADAAPVQARVRIAALGVNLTAAQDGGFRLSGIPVGEQTLDVRMLGYAPVVLPVVIR